MDKTTRTALVSGFPRGQTTALWSAIVLASALFVTLLDPVSAQQPQPNQPAAAAQIVPRVPEIAGLEHSGYVTSDTLWEALEQSAMLPRRIAIVGGGPVGLLLANLFGHWGVKTLLCERNADTSPSPKAIFIDDEFMRTLDRVGSGAWQPDQVKSALEAQDRAACGPVSPPDGLYMTGVGYPVDPFAAA